MRNLGFWFAINSPIEEDPSMDQYDGKLENKKKDSTEEIKHLRK